MLASYPTTTCEYTMPPDKGVTPEWARVLRTRRVSLGYRSQEALALKTQEGKSDGEKDTISQRTVSAIETGDQDPTAMTSARLGAYMAALQWTPEQFTEATGLRFPGVIIHGSLGVMAEGGPQLRLTPGDRLRKLREERGLEREYVADHSEGAISARRLANLEEKPGLWERVKTDETHALAFVYEMKLSDFLETVNGTKFPGRPNIYTDEAVLAHPDLTHGVRYVPIYNMAGMGPGGDDGDIVGYADIPSEWSGDHAGYKVFGDSMSPEIRDGAVVIIKKQDRAAPGNDIICWTPDDGMLCKHLDKIEDGYHVLTSVNIDYKPIWTRAIKIYGIIVQSRNPHKVVNGIH